MVPGTYHQIFGCFFEMRLPVFWYMYSFKIPSYKSCQIFTTDIEHLSSYSISDISHHNNDLHYTFVDYDRCNLLILIFLCKMKHNQKIAIVSSYNAQYASARALTGFRQIIDHCPLGIYIIIIGHCPTVLFHISSLVLLYHLGAEWRHWCPSLPLTGPLIV